MTFAEIELVTGARLPPKAQHHRAWWSNNPSNNVMTKVWLAAGYQTERVDMAGRKLVFRRMRSLQPPSPAGMQEHARMFDNENKMTAPGNLKPRRNPLFGALQGTFTIEPGWDLTRPALDPEELEEMEANLDRTADLIEQGLSRKPR